MEDRTIAHARSITERTSEEPRFRLSSRVREVWAYREILGNLIRKELKVKYTASVLGAIWSLLNPVVFLAVFSFVTIMLGNNIPNFPVFLLSGLLAWNLFSVSLGTGARSVIDNGNLVKKVAFPREILPLSVAGVALVDFVLQSTVLLAFILISGYGFHLPELALYPLALLTLVVVTVAVTFWVSSVNVRYRDVEHLVGLGLLIWFWMTPIVYPGSIVQQKLLQHEVLGVNLWNVYMVNPLCSVVFGFQRALYGQVSPMSADGPVPVLPDVSLAWLAGVLAITLAVALVVLLWTWRSFFRRAGDFAEDL